MSLAASSKQSDLPPVVVILGPTGVGKTTLALRLARAWGAEIVSADSLQVYRELDIGTAKPTPEQRALIPHHLIDQVFPDEPFDAAQYSRQAREILAGLHARSVIPLIVGGTGLYIRALLYGLFSDVVQDHRVRQALKQEMAAVGLPALYNRLQFLDPEAAEKIHPHDAFRIIRALEVIAATGQPLSAQHQAHRFSQSPYRIFKLGLNLPRERLYARIDSRVEEMLAQGLVAEVQELRRRYDQGLKPFQSLGYWHIIAFLNGHLSWEEAVLQLKRDTRRYAKRQLTWFKGEPEIHWLEPDQMAVAEIMLKKFITCADSSL
jgi:tRNA dimethylallyltransferase